MNLKKRKRNKKTIKTSDVNKKRKCTSKKKFRMTMSEQKCTSEERFGRRNFEKNSDDDE